MEKQNSALSEIFSHISASAYFLGGSLCAIVGVGMIVVCTYFEASVGKFIPMDASALRNYGHIWLAFGSILAFLGPIVGVLESILEIRRVIHKVNEISHRIDRLESDIIRKASSSPYSFDK